MFHLLWDLYQQRQIGDLRRDTKRTEVEAVRSARDVTEREFQTLQERLDRMALVLHAMWSLVSDKTGITEADLAKRATELDAADGTVDGQITPPRVRCTKCNSVISNKFRRCLFCGKEQEEGSNALGSL